MSNKPRNRNTQQPVSEERKAELARLRKEAKDNLEKAQKEAKAAGVEDDEDEEDDEDDEGMDKSAFAEGLNTLEKALGSLVVSARHVPTRREELAEKAKTSRLSKEERAEFDRLVDGRPLAARLDAETDLSKAMDISPALDTLGTHVAESVDALTATLEKSMLAGEERFGALAKTVLAIGDLVRTLASENAEMRKSLEEVLDGPARGPRAEELPLAGARDRQTGMPLAKPNAGAGAAAGGGSGGDDKLDLRIVKRVLEVMHGDSMQKSMGGNSRGGVSIRNEMARASSGLQPTPQMAAEIRSFLQQNPAYAQPAS